MRYLLEPWPVRSDTSSRRTTRNGGSIHILQTSPISPILARRLFLMPGMSRKLRPIVAVRIARPIGFLKSVNKRRNERLYSLLANDYAQNLNVRRITHLPHIVRKTRISGKTKIVSDGYLPVVYLAPSA